MQLHVYGPMTLPSDNTIDTWIRLLRAREAAYSAVEKSLKDAGFPPPAWYDVLLELEQAGANGLRPYELQAALLLPQYGVSRLIERIGKAGYLQRHEYAKDGRGQVLTTTQAGRQLRRSMWPVYGAAIEQAVGAKLTAGEMRLLHRVLGKLLPDNH